MTYSIPKLHPKEPKEASFKKEEYAKKKDGI